MKIEVVKSECKTENKKYTFNTIDTKLKKFNGKAVTIQRQMTRALDNIDEDDLPKMYKVITDDGIFIEVFADELTEIN